jgi:hypothetical protein
MNSVMNGLVDIRTPEQRRIVEESDNIVRPIKMNRIIEPNIVKPLVHIDKPKFKVCLSCVTMNDDLYEISKSFYPESDDQLEIVTEKITHKDPNYYGLFPLLDQIKNTDYDYMVLIDDDCFVLDKKVFKDWIKDCIEKECIVSGIRDGGDYIARQSFPIVPNNCLVFLNTKEIRAKWSEAEVARYYTTFVLKFDRQKLPYWTSLVEDITFKYRWSFQPQHPEPYYAVYLHLLDIFGEDSFDFLVAQDCSMDWFSTEIRGRETIGGYKSFGRTIAVHTWYAREWKNKGSEHQLRIQKIIDWVKKNAV